MTFANFPELGRALTQQCSRAVLPEQEFAFLQRIVLVETRTLDLLDLVVPSTNSATQPQLLMKCRQIRDHTTNGEIFRKGNCLDHGEWPSIISFSNEVTIPFFFCCC